MTRIAALESQLAQLTGGEPAHAAETARLRREREELAGEVARLQAELAAARRELDELRRGLPEPPQELRSVAEYNRSKPALTGRKGARVLCPRCLEFGERVEMVWGPNERRLGAETSVYCLREVQCPRCAWLDHKRTQ